MHKKYPSVWFLLPLLLAPYLAFALEDASCPNARGIATGDTESGQYGPYDYRNPQNKASLHLVEIAHFQMDVATLKSTNPVYVQGGLDYTLRAFPNHHRALQSLSDLASSRKISRFDHMNFSVPCYFIRAKHFTPDDGVVDAIYAYYLSRIGQRDLAASEIELVKGKAFNNAKAMYFAGLALYYLGDYQKAREFSAIAKKLGSGAVGLDLMLSRVDGGKPSKSGVQDGGKASKN